MQLALDVDRLVVVVALLLLAAVLTAAVATRLGAKLRIPGALLFLGLGMLVGVDGLGLIQLDDTTLVRDLGVLALLLILFEGGLTTKPTDLRLAALPGTLLATVGVALTAGATGIGVWLLFDVELVTGLLLGAVVASTDAAAVFSMMRTAALPRRVSAIVRLESGANDPIAVMLTVGLIATIQGPTTAGDWAVFAMLQLLGGGAVGAAVGGMGVVLLRRVDLGVDGLYPVLAAGVAGLAYGVAAWVGASGFVAVYLAGLLVGGLVPRHRRSILGFHEAMANAAEIGLFLLLGLLVVPSRLVDIIPQGLAVAALLLVVARPIAVGVCSIGSRLGWREQALVSWSGLRGAVPIVLATLPYTTGIAGGSVLFDVVFFVVLVSVLVQGLTLQPLVRWLGLGSERPAWSPVAEALPLEGIDVDLVELHVTDDLRIADQRLRDLPQLGTTLVAAIVRGSRVVIPKGDTVLLAGDVLLLTAPRDGTVLARITSWARGEIPDVGVLSDGARGDDAPEGGVRSDGVRGDGAPEGDDRD